MKLYKNLNKTNKLSYIKDLKLKAISLFNEGEEIYDIKYNEIFEFVLQRDYVAIATQPERFKKATEEDKLKSKIGLNTNTEEPLNSNIGIVRKIKPEYIGVCKASKTLAEAINNNQISYFQYKALWKYIDAAKKEVAQLIHIPDLSYRNYLLTERKANIINRVNQDNVLNNGNKFPINCVRSIISTYFKIEMRKCYKKRKFAVENKGWWQKEKPEDIKKIDEPW